MIIHNPKELAMAVRQYRKKLQLKQSELADTVGLKQATISAFENNPDATKLKTFFRILSATNLVLQIQPAEEAAKKTEWNEDW